MITGFNSDIEHGGKVFHVQTEEKGVDNPVVITLVYCGGEIVTSLEASYADLVDDDPEAPEGEVRRRMNDQHQGLIRDILRGRFNPPLMPYGHDLISDRSLDELVLGFLEDEITERTAKVGRVLNKLERFLSAAEQAQLEPEAPAELAVAEDNTAQDSGETVDAVDLDSEPDVPTPDVDSQVAVPTPERRRRKTGWVWAAVAAAIVLGVAGLYVIRSLENEPSEAGVAVPSPAPAVQSKPAATDERTEQQAGASVMTEVPSPVAEPIAEATPPEATPSRPTQTAPPSPRVPEVLDSPVATLKPVIVVDPSDTQPEPATAIPVESAAPTVVEQPVVAEEPVVTDQPAVTLRDVDVPPRASQRDLPRYTRRARRLQQEGVVQIRILIDSHGDVAEAELTAGIPGSDLNEAALAATGDWNFSPARKNGQRVAVWKEVTFEFTVRPDRTTSVRIRE